MNPTPAEIRRARIACAAGATVSLLVLLLSDGNVPRVVSIVGIALCGLFYLLVVSA